MPPTGVMWKRMFLKPLITLLKSVLAEPKRSIIKILSDGVKSTSEIYAELQQRGFIIARSTLYYYLSVLEELGIIEGAGYKETGGGAPEKLWRLKTRRVGIDLVTGEIFKE